MQLFHSASLQNFINSDINGASCNNSKTESQLKFMMTAAVLTSVCLDIYIMENSK